MVHGDAVDWSLAPHFVPGEWGPRVELVSPALIYEANAIREACGAPFIVLCSYATEGHSQKSYHYVFPDIPGRERALAVDFRFGDAPGGRPLSFERQFAHIAAREGVGAIGFYPFGFCTRRGRKRMRPFWHIDLRPRDNGRRLYWVRDAWGQYLCSFDRYEHVVPWLGIAEMLRSLNM